MKTKIFTMILISLSALTSFASSLTQDIVYRCDDDKQLISNTPSYCLNPKLAKGEYVDLDNDYYHIAYCGQLQLIGADNFVLQIKAYTKNGVHKKYMFVTSQDASIKTQLRAMAVTQAQDSTYDCCINADDIERNSIIQAVHVNL